MKIEVNTKVMQDAIKKLNKVLPKKTSIPFLETVLLKAENNTITAIADDLDNTLMLNIEGDAEEKGKTLLDVETLKLISKLKDKRQIIIIEDNRITVGNKQINFEVDENWIEDFPVRLQDCEEHIFTCTEQELADLLIVKHASSKDETRPVYCSVVINSEFFMASDTYRLARRKIPFDNKLDKQVLIRNKSANMLESLLELKKNKSVECFLDDKFMTFKTEDMMFSTRLIDEKFPELDYLYSNKSISTITVNRESFLEELEFATGIKNDKRIFLEYKNSNELKLLIKGGSKNIMVDFPARITDEFELIILYYDFIIDCFKHHDKREMEIKITGSLTPVYIEEDLFLPMREV